MTIVPGFPSPVCSHLHEIHSRALVFVAGVDWGFDLRGVRIDAANVVYSAHVYPNRSRRQGSGRFGHRCSDDSLFIAEWGGDSDDLKSGSGLISYLRKVACGWTAWNWVDSPKLVRNARAGDYTPTEFGNKRSHGGPNRMIQGALCPRAHCELVRSTYIKVQ
jgi:hypothetical protein